MSPRCARPACDRFPPSSSSASWTRSSRARSGCVRSNPRPFPAEETMTLTLRPGVSTADTEYGTTLLDEDSGEYFTLNPTASLVLRTLLDGGTPRQAVEVLTAEYDVDVETAGRDVAELLDELRSA